MERGQKSKKEKVSVAATFILASEKVAKRPLGLSLLNYHQLPLLLLCVSCRDTRFYFVSCALRQEEEKNKKMAKKTIGTKNSWKVFSCLCVCVLSFLFSDSHLFTTDGCFGGSNFHEKSIDLSCGSIQKLNVTR